MTYAHTRPNLYGRAVHHAWRKLGLSCVAFGVSVVILVAGALTGFLLIIGVPLFLLSLIAIPAFAIGLFDPTRQATLRRLGPTAAARRQALDAISAEIAGPYAWHLRAGSGVIHITGNYLVYDGSDLAIVRVADVLWHWPMTRRKSPYACVKTRYGDKVEMPLGSQDGHIFAAFEQAFPFAFAGYSPQLRAYTVQQLAYEIDRRRAASASHG